VDQAFIYLSTPWKVSITAAFLYAGSRPRLLAVGGFGAAFDLGVRGGRPC
jgi:hypothetical protein